MKRLNQMIGLPVMCGERRLGFVRELCLSPDAHCLIGMNMQRGMRASTFISVEQIKTLDERRVELRGAPCRQKARSATRLGPACDARGMRLGVVTDAAIEEATLQIAALELSFGPLDDLIGGRRWIRRFTVDPVTGGIVIPLTEQDGTPQPKGGKPS